MNKISDGIVVSTRVRLARNIEGLPFPSYIENVKQAGEIKRKISSTLSRLERFRLYSLDSISDEEAVCLMENHLISPKLIQNKQFSAVLIDREETVSVMINEEDHLREQCILNGLELKLAYDTMAEVDNYIANSIQFAYDDQFGYLTACPTNLGTGLRASVMMFLPALTMSGALSSIFEEVSKAGLTVRGVYGEGSDAEGYMYQISNEVTLGLTEQDIINKVEKTVKRISELEIEKRQGLLKSEKALSIRDGCMRAYGILTNCALLTTSEFINFSAKVKLGACLGYIDIKDISIIDDLYRKLTPSNITKETGRVLSPIEQDMYRASYCAKHLKQIQEK